MIGLVDNLLRPPLVGKDTRLPDYVVLVSTVGGLSLFGINGFVIGPLIAALFIAGWRLFRDEQAGHRGRRLPDRPRRFASRRRRVYGRQANRRGGHGVLPEAQGAAVQVLVEARGGARRDPRRGPGAPAEPRRARRGAAEPARRAARPGRAAARRRRRAGARRRDAREPRGAADPVRHGRRHLAQGHRAAWPRAASAAASARARSGELLAAEIAAILEPVARPMPIYPKRPQVVLVVGVNGSGKTTTIGKLASQFRAAGKKVVIAAGDTFRAAAVEQLQILGRARRGAGDDRAAGLRPGQPRLRRDGPRRGRGRRPPARSTPPGGCRTATT